MGKSIYSLLNEIETDFSEYETVEFSEEEKKRHKQKVLQEVRNMGNKRTQAGKRSKIWKTAAGAAAACALVVTAAGAANPAFAKGLFSDVFGKLIENAQGEKYEEEETERYTVIGKHAVEVQDEVAKQKDKGSYVTTAEHHGVTVSISDIYCDGYILYYTTTLQTENEALGQADGIMSRTDGDAIETLEIEGMDMSGYASKAFTKNKDGCFVSANEINLMSKESTKLDEEGTIVVDWTLHDLTGYLFDKWDDQGEYWKTVTVDGEWNLQFPVTVDQSANEVYAVDKEDNGVLVKSATKTKAGLVVEVSFPSQDSLINTDIGIKDAQGNWLQWLGQRTDNGVDGTVTSQIMVLYDGQKDLEFELCRKDGDATVLAMVPFQIPQ